MKLKISLGCERYDRVQPILDGRVEIEGCEANIITLSPEEAFHRAFNGAEFDVCELSGSSYLMTLARGEMPYVAVPAFVSKCFRHSAIYVRADRNIREPRDLIGKRVGAPEYQMTACLWVRGILEDEYGVKPRDMTWLTGGLEMPGRRERAALSVDPKVSVNAIPPDKTLSELLVEGDLDAIISPRVPSCYETHPTLVRRMFEDYRNAEEQYFSKTKIFPIMHFMGIRRSLITDHPWLPVSVYKAFLEAKNIAVREMREPGYNFVTLPWVYREVTHAEKLMGQDYWSYGVQANRTTLEAMTRYAFTQGHTARNLSVDELFHPSTLEFAKK